VTCRGAGVTCLAVLGPCAGFDQQGGCQQLLLLLHLLLGWASVVWPPAGRW
jgi:hypothetical protein